MTDMDDMEISVIIRGRELESLDLHRMLRWMAAASIQPHVKGVIQPTKLLNLPGDVSRKTNKNPKEIRQKLEKAEEIWQKWDNPDTKWVKEKKK